MKIVASLAVAAALVLAASPVAAATTMSAKVEPLETGTPSAPKPLDVSLVAVLDSDALGTPTGVTKYLSFALPSGFIAGLADFGICARDRLAKEGPGACPSNSVIGSAVMTGTATALPGRQETLDKGVLVNIGGDKIAYWWKITQPVTLSGVFDGAITREADPFGPVVTFDFSSIADGSAAGGLEIRLNRLEVRFLRTAGTAAAPKPAKKKAKKKAKRCRKAKKRSTKKAAGAKRRPCHKRKRKPRASHAGAHSAQAPGQTTISAFRSTGCSGGSWPFQARIVYEDNRKAQADTTVTCSQTPPGQPEIPCVPLVQACPVAFRHT